MEGEESGKPKTESADTQEKDKQAAEQQKKRNAGIALIKPEFVVQNHQRTVTEKYLPAAAVQEIKQLTAESTTKRASQQTNEEVPQKKSKLRGRNKKRPHDKLPQNKDKLCPSVIAERECSFGDRCKFSHDVEEYVRQRPPAHSENCYLYKTFGKCAFGVSCLCADTHTGDNYTQLVREDLWRKSSVQLFTTNKLPHSVLMSLCKKKYNFNLTNQVLLAINEGKTVERQKIERPKHYTVKLEVDDKHESTTKHMQLEASDSSSALNTSEKPPLNLSDQSDMQGVTQCKEEIIISDKTVNIQNTQREGESNANSISIKETAEITQEEISQVTSEAADVTTCMSAIMESKGAANSESQILNGADAGFHSGLQSAAHSVQERLEHVDTEEGVIRLRPQEVRKVDFRDKLYLAPLTTVGNLPFRRICKSLGADITCSEMATATGLLQGHNSEWALMKRHHTEDVFGAQVCGSNAEVMTRCAQVLMENTDVDFIDINCGCPIDLFYKKGEGCALMAKATRLQNVVRGMTAVMDVPLTVKMRTGIFENKYIADRVITNLRDLDVVMVTLHGRSREQRYTRSADWDYIQKCAEVAAPMPLFGNGDILSYEEYNKRKETTGVAGCLIARGALMKPWIFTEIREQRHWDISSGERLSLLQDFCHYGLEHWGSDKKGVQTTRRFLLEWLSFLYRYIPVGVLEQVPQKINQKPPYYVGRDELETLMASPNSADWIKISEMLLGPVPDDFQFLPKHKANSYQ